MSNERGCYGKSGTRVGASSTTHVGVEHSSSIGAWVIGAVAVGGAIFFARHQAKQIEQLYKTSGLPYQSFTGSLREGASALPAKARSAYRNLTTRKAPAAVKPTSSKRALEPVSEAVEASEAAKASEAAAHSRVKARTR